MSTLSTNRILGSHKARLFTPLALREINSKVGLAKKNGARVRQRRNIVLPISLSSLFLSYWHLYLDL